MRKIFLFFVFLLLPGLALFCPVRVVWAQTDEQTAYDLLKNSQTYFPRLLIDEKFNQNEELYVGDNESCVSVVRQKGGKLTSTYFPKDISTEAGRSAFYAGTYYGTLTEFHLHAELTQTAEFPEGSGYCFIQYTNAPIAGEETRETVFLDVGFQAGMYTTFSGSRKYTILADLSADHQLNRTFNVDLIRVNGVGYLFVDGNFLTAVEDGIQTNLTWMIGAGTKVGGEQSQCTYDNLWLRRK